jgi:hypothetical protein
MYCYDQMHLVIFLAVGFYDEQYANTLKPFK